MMGEPIRPRTKSERMALLTGFAMALEMVEKNGAQAARDELRLMYESEERMTDQFERRVYESASPETQKQMRERGMTPWIDRAHPTSANVPLDQTTPDRVVLTHDDREMCPCCGELPAQYIGGFCRRCQASIEDERLGRNE